MQEYTMYKTRPLQLEFLATLSGVRFCLIRARMLIEEDSNQGIHRMLYPGLHKGADATSFMLPSFLLHFVTRLIGDLPNLSRI